LELKVTYNLTKFLFVFVQSDRNSAIIRFKHNKRYGVIHVTDKFRDHSRLRVIYSDRRRLALAVCTEPRLCKYSLKIVVLHHQLHVFTFGNVIAVTDPAVKLQINADHIWKFSTFRRCLAQAQTFALNAK
jgi:hypothetical protein